MKVRTERSADSSSAVPAFHADGGSEADVLRNTNVRRVSATSFRQAAPSNGVGGYPLDRLLMLSLRLYLALCRQT